MKRLYALIGRGGHREVQKARMNLQEKMYRLYQKRRA